MCKSISEEVLICSNPHPFIGFMYITASVLVLQSHFRTRKYELDEEVMTPGTCE